MTNESVKTKPITDEEWTIHVLNIHGTFFERWCANVIESKPGFRVTTTNYPVEFPPAENGIRGKESALDIQAETIDDFRRLTLIVECKKNNPEFVDWIFFPTKSYRKYIETPAIIFDMVSPSPPRWEVKTDRVRTRFAQLRFADEGRETKGNYQSLLNNSTKTKTSNSSISKAAYQVALAAQAVFLEEIQRSKKAIENPNPTTSLRFISQVILPVIVTTARLFVCDFDAKNVAAGTGEIPFDKTELTECPYLIYTYSLPRHLQHIPEEDRAILNQYEIESFVRMQIMIVHSKNLEEFLNMASTTFNQRY